MPSCRQDSEKTLTLTKAADDTEMIERHQQEDLSERLAGDRKSNRRDTRAPITSRKVTMTSIVVSSIIVMIAIVPFCWAFRENTGQAAQVKTDVTNVFNNYNNYIESQSPNSSSMEKDGENSPENQDTNRLKQRPAYSETRKLDLPSYLQSEEGFRNLLNAFFLESGMPTWDAGVVEFDHTGIQQKAHVYISDIDEQSISYDEYDSISCSDIRRVHLRTFIVADNKDSALEQMVSLFNMPDLIKSSSLFGASDENVQPYEAREGICFEWRFRDDVEWGVSGSLHQIDTLGNKKAYEVTVTLTPYRELTSR